MIKTFVIHIRKTFRRNYVQQILWRKWLRLWRSRHGLRWRLRRLHLDYYLNFNFVQLCFQNWPMLTYHHLIASLLLWMWRKEKRFRLLTKLKGALTGAFLFKYFHVKKRKIMHFNTFLFDNIVKKWYNTNINYVLCLAMCKIV